MSNSIQIEKGSMNRGDLLNISKTVAGGLRNLRIGLGWDPQEIQGGPEFDADVLLFMMDSSKKCKAENVYYYNNLVSKDGEQREIPGGYEVVKRGYITHNGDNRNGEGDGDDETIDIELSKVPSDLTMGVICVSIHDYETRKQTFGNVDNAFVRVIDADTNTELGKMNLTFSACSSTAIIFGGILKHEGEWFFQAPKNIEGVDNGIVGLLTKFGLGVQ